tara:strand:+ start:46176 stop:47183 length:1008 start_codon:yes stop_codon:yes gene_type:complete
MKLINKRIFIVGNSRSGTTMMSRILGKHSNIITLNEIHFFGQLWTSKDQNKILNFSDSVYLFSKLLCIQKFGIFQQKNQSQFDDISIEWLGNKKLNSLELFDLFLNYMCENNKRIHICNQTPRDVFYLSEILSNFQNVKIINMIRDPRDILLSQKNKWKRRYLGANLIPFSESVRSFFNYHPITISKIWNSSINATKKVKDQIINVKYEELANFPEEKIKEVCNFLEIEFDLKMLDVPKIGSSTNHDLDNKNGIVSNNIGKWKSGGLLNAEIYLCQKICRINMLKNGYKIKNISFFNFNIIIFFITFPFKMFISFFLNIRRVKNLRELIIKRILN